MKLSATKTKIGAENCFLRITIYEANFGFWALMNPPRQPPCSSESRVQGRALPWALQSPMDTPGAQSSFNNHGNNPNNDQGKKQGRVEKKKTQVGRNNT